jgi:hypothetical protein
MKKKGEEINLRAGCKFSLEDDDSGGPTGPDYLLLQFAPDKAALKKNKFLQGLNLSIYFKEQVDPDEAQTILTLLKKNAKWVQYQYFE